MSQDSNASLYWIVAGLVGAAGLYALWRYTATVQNSGGSSSGGNQLSGSQSSAVDSIAETFQGVAGVLDRGFRNNNPGNIEYNPAINWLGQTGQDSSGYVIFDTMANGLRAIALDIRNQQTLHGLNTVAAIISKWSATDQEAYIANVSAFLGVDPHETIDVTDPATLASIVQAIVIQENGHLLAATITGDQYSNAVALV